MLCPNDHLRLIVELMREGGMELTRRWVAALVLVAPEDRESLVEAIEERVTAAYDLPGNIGVVHTEDPTPEAPEADEPSAAGARATKKRSIETKPRRASKKKTAK